jgi:hypothetical protein
LCQCINVGKSRSGWERNRVIRCWREKPLLMALLRSHHDNW